MARRRPILVVATLAALSALAAGSISTSLAAGPASAHLGRLLQGADGGGFPGAETPLGDADRRGPRLAPLRSSVAALGRMGSGLHVSWTQYGTPLSLTRDRGFLATAQGGDAEQVARGYLRAHAGVWGLSAAQVDALQLVQNEPLSQGSTSRSVSFQQQVSGLDIAQDGYVVVGVAQQQIAIVTSSLVPSALLGGAPSTTPGLGVGPAVLAAARDAGITSLTQADLTPGKLDGAGFRLVAARGLHQPQRARLRVLATTDRGARLVWETDIEDVAGGRALATMSYVDAQTGAVLLRRDAVNTLAVGATAPSVPAQVGGAPGTFQGVYSAKACSAPIPLTNVVVGDRTLAIDAAATTSPANDILISVLRNGIEIASIDTATSPEAGVVSFNPPVTAKDKVVARVCPVGVQPGPFDFAGSYVSSNRDVPASQLPGPFTDGTATGPATWRAFASNPQLARPNKISADDRYKVCSGRAGGSNVLKKDLSGCNFVYTDGSRLPYDADPVTGLSSFTTLGNNAVTSNAQASSSLTPGGPFLPPASPTRDYTATFNDQWHAALCNPSALLPPGQGNVNAAILNLFVGHNRIHDFAYRLGLTEVRGALQTSNFGKTAPQVAEGDPELGNAQNAALSHDAFGVSNQVTGPAAGVGLTGRDNANQITLQDGVPGITNQYLFQPIVGFYSPCTDGDLDASVFLHEYTHAISNRLIAGPATGLSGQQGGSMGESWSDLDAIEYLNEFGLAGGRGEDPYAEGAYVTGNSKVGIRDYNLAPSKNPLNYSDFGFDTTGPEVHADGEIWNAVMMTVRQALINKYEKKFHYGNKALQISCAVGRTATGAPGPAWNKCPGNRRWVTYMYDAMILQANGSPSMVDMKDAMLAAVLLRDPKDYATVADAYASRGLGVEASSGGSNDLNPVPSFASPDGAKNAKVTFQLVDATTGHPVHGAVFVGMYTARCRPIATTLGEGNLPAKATVMGGTYQLTVQALGYGIQRFIMTVKPGTRTQVLKLAENVASSAYGSGVSSNAGGLRLGRIIDDSEVSNGAFDGQPVAGRVITVRFGRGLVTFNKIAVSSLHHPALPATAETAAEFEGRLLGIRAFDLQASHDGGKTFTTIYRSPNDFFPAYRPRAVAPNLILRTVTLAHPVTADFVRLIVRSNTCTGGTDFNYEQENDPTNPSDCRSTKTNTTRVTITELEVFRQ